MIRVPEPTVHFKGPYTRKMWRVSMSAGRLQRAMRKALDPIWRDMSVRYHPLLDALVPRR